ncbi:MAG: biotin--[acetyl-CoA-carboxylase] ligase [Chloroflexi bacterium]|nr:biotin--[acetyl-CoA-carboxylase] ligase [Chloroflexota bacterium]
MMKPRISRNISPLFSAKNSNASLIGRNILYFTSLHSTMDTAKRMAMEGMGEGTIVLASQQTGGRGRLGRTWLSSPDSSVLLSIILRPEVSQLPQLNMVAGLAIAQSIEKATGLSSVLKWPNDVLLNGKKVCGILMENLFEGSKLVAAIVGIGLNVRLDTLRFASISATATSLSQEVGREISPWEMLPFLLRELEQSYRALQCGRSIAIYEEWLARVETLGKMVRLKSGDTLEEGYAESINVDGSIMLRRSDGSLIRVVTGE